MRQRGRGRIDTAFGGDSQGAFEGELKFGGRLLRECLRGP